MPPSTAKSICSSSLHRQACANSRLAHRTFASSAARDSVISPESPRFIEVPRPPQQHQKHEKDVKGVLPVPRNIFISRSKNPKSSKKFLRAATPEPASKPVFKGPDSARLAWKARLAETRRKSLRQSVHLLEARSKDVELKRKSVSMARKAEQKHLIHAPEREDEKYTNASVSLAVQNLLTQRAAQESSGTDIEEKLRNIHHQEVAKAAEQQDLLHTLYQHARDFIVTEQQLSKKIDEMFGSDEQPVGFGRYKTSNSRSIWAKGPPSNATQMLDTTQNRKGTAMERTSGYTGVSQSRIHKMAEELTGGKI